MWCFDRCFCALCRQCVAQQQRPEKHRHQHLPSSCCWGSLRWASWYHRREGSWRGRRPQRKALAPRSCRTRCCLGAAAKWRQKMRKAKWPRAESQSVRYSSPTASATHSNEWQIIEMWSSILLNTVCILWMYLILSVIVINSTNHNYYKDGAFVHSQLYILTRETCFATRMTTCCQTINFNLTKYQ